MLQSHASRLRGESGPITDRAAFRLCIAAVDCQRLLDDSQWPESVIISEWFYIKPTADRRQRLRPARPAVNIGVYWLMDNDGQQ